MIGIPPIAMLMPVRKSKPLTDKREAPAVAPEYMLDDQIGFRLRIAMQRHTSIFMSQMIEDLTQTQFAALAKLLEVGACSQNHLGRLIYLDASTIKGVVDRLRLRGLVATCNDPNDRRRKNLGGELACRECRVAVPGFAGRGLSRQAGLLYSARLEASPRRGVFPCSPRGPFLPCAQIRRPRCPPRPPTRP